MHNTYTHTCMHTNACAHTFILTRPLWRTLAVVGIDSIQTGPPILATLSRTVVHIVLAVGPIEAWFGQNSLLS